MTPLSWTALSIAFVEDGCERILKIRAKVHEGMLGVHGTKGVETTSCGGFKM